MSLRLPLSCVFAAALWAGAIARPAAAGELETVFFNNDQVAVEQAARATLKRTPDDPEASAWLAEAAMKQGKWDEARAALAHAGSSTVTGLLAHGDFDWYTGDFAAARDHYKAALGMGPGDRHARWGLASSLAHIGGEDEALQLIAPLVAEGGKLDPEFHGWVLVVVGASKGFKAMHANLLEQLRLSGEVRGAFEQALGLSPKNANALSSLGRYYLLAPGPFGDSGKAIELLDRSNTLDPFFYLNDAYLIRAYLKAGQADKARSERAFYQAKFEGQGIATTELAKVKF